ncbi:MAG: hypothetical protein CENE_01453 [Candidatus Celerinatantimonas neptuna]|nr:MAG: hypothetical protein CENE_01453 [Candidatus Celerinatantimonas neptuna]
MNDQAAATAVAECFEKGAKWHSSVDNGLYLWLDAFFVVRRRSAQSGNVKIIRLNRYCNGWFGDLSDRIIAIEFPSCSKNSGLI